MFSWHSIISSFPWQSRILDDDFEEFPADAWPIEDQSGIYEDLLIKEWDDDHVDDNFIQVCPQSWIFWADLSFGVKFSILHVCVVLFLHPFLYAQFSSHSNYAESWEGNWFSQNTFHICIFGFSRGKLVLIIGFCIRSYRMWKSEGPPNSMRLCFSIHWRL